MDNINEAGYLKVLAEIMEQPEKSSRNSTVKSKFAVNLKFTNIYKGFPLLTTKKMFWKGIYEELFWFIKGDTDAKKLAAKKVNIWNANSSRAELDKLGHFNREEGDCGPIYGFQWRYFGAKYVDCHTDYTGQGFDQLQYCIDTLRSDPHSRRCIFTGLNPLEYGNIALPPCHVSYQFVTEIIDGKTYLNCLMYQRSGDMFLGVPFNIASTSLLLSLIASTVDMIPKDVAITICDAHIYKDHYNAVTEQLLRTPKQFPILNINKKSNINDYTPDDLHLENYQCDDTIKAIMIA